MLMTGRDDRIEDHALALAAREWGGTVRGKRLQPLASWLASEVKEMQEAHNKAWHIVHCLGTDKHAMDWLEKLKFETYYPAVREMRPVPRKRLSAKQRASGVVVLKPQLVPFFPRYIFTQFDMKKDGWREIFQFAGIGGMICQGDLPVWVPDSLIEAIRSREVGGAVPGNITARVVFAVGDKVRVTDGPFAMFPGVVERGLDKPIETIDPEDRIKVCVSIFGRATPVDLEISQVVKL